MTHLIEKAPPRTVVPRRPVRIRPRCHTGSNGRVRPPGAPLRYRGSGVVISRAPHRRRPVTAATTVGLALLAALITVWLGVVGQFGAGVDDSASAVPDRLAVVRVQAGETLPQLAARVAPGAPTGQVVQTIRELNGLDAATLQAGQTLIAPIG